jgi:hypothetical protein
MNHDSDRPLSQIETGPSRRGDFGGVIQASA